MPMLEMAPSLQRELSDVCLNAVNQWMQSTRGAHVVGAGAVINRTSNGSFDIVPQNPQYTFVATVWQTGPTAERVGEILQQLQDGFITDKEATTKIIDLVASL